jgi:heme-degrading monooxygenase HmoA
MVARVTLAEIDLVRMPLADAIELFRESILSELQEQPGYEGVYVFTTPEGKALVITFWHDQEAANAGLASGFYAAQVEKFVTVYRASPGRETYDIAIEQAPQVTPS